MNYSTILLRFYGLDIADVYLNGTDESESDITYELTVAAKMIALYVYIESEFVDFIASDNFFSMEPSETRIIFLWFIENVNSGKILNELPIDININSIKVYSLYDLKLNCFV